jgi:8-oxo-dGTP pyrophosphatase MutT (NUDIX family)
MNKKFISMPKKVYSNPYMEVVHTKVDFGEFIKDYYVLNLQQRAGVVAVNDAGCVLLTRQYRFLIDRDSWEIPGGGLDNNEAPIAAAVRECKEETGIECSALTPLLVFYPGLDNFDNKTHVFYSTNVRQIKPFSPNAKEVLEIRWVPLLECLEMIASETILDVLTISGLLAYRALKT